MHNESSLHRTSRFQDYLGEFVYGSIDGSVTTFAVVAGAAGADLPISTVLILGFANLLADGFSMSVGAYLSSRSERDTYEKHRRIEYQEVEDIPEMEREEIRQIYRAKGFEGELLEQVVSVITADKDRWVDVMMKEELEMVPDHKSPLGMAAVTFSAFVTVGLVPLAAYLFNAGGGLPPGRLFAISCVFTSLAFLFIGWLKARVTQTNYLKAIAETLFLGGSAAAVSYVVGDLLEKLLG
ncbi:MAG: VIT1/CCC1 transporter family protein [Bacteroidia bacterium]|nr:VIT1/CCC1 transporter family protein [Bacteroidia bacterium]